MLGPWEELFIVVIILMCFVFMILLMVCLLGPGCPLNRHSPCRYNEPEDKSPLSKKIQLAGIEPTFWTHKGDKSPTTIEDKGRRDSEYDLISASVYDTYESLKNILPGSEDVPARLEPPGIAAFALCIKENQEGRRLCLRMKHIDNLLPRHYGGQAFIYLKFSLYSKNMIKPNAVMRLLSEAKTSTKSRTKTTDFYETFFLNMPQLKKAHQYVLQLMSYEYDKYSRHEWSGQIDIQLEGVDLTEEVAFMETFHAPNEPSRGEILLSLSYLPIAEKLHVTVVKLRDVKKEDIEGMSQIFVKAVLIKGKETLQKKRTKKIESDINLTFNETLAFDVPPGYLNEVAILIMVVVLKKGPSDGQGYEVAIGKSILGEPGYGSGHAHWTEMMNAHRKPVAYWHTLE